MLLSLKLGLHFYFAWNLSVLFFFVKMDTVLTITGYNMLSDAFSIMLIHLREVRKYSISKVCMLLQQHHVTFPGMIRCPKLVVLLKICACIFGRKDTVLTIRESNLLFLTLPIILSHPRMVLKGSRSNGCMSSQHIVTFSRLIWCPKLIILLELESCFW